MTTVGSYEAKTHLSELLERVEKGERFTITKRGKPVAILIPAETTRAEVDRVVQEMLSGYGWTQPRHKARHSPVGRAGKAALMAVRRPKRSLRSSETFVVDCSVVFAWYFADEANRYADSVAMSLSSAKAVVPVIWPLEVANTLLMGERRGRSTELQAAAFLSRLVQLPIAIDDQTTVAAWSFTMQLARQHQLSAYDAAYLELALRLGTPLATLDEALITGARRAGVFIYTPAGSTPTT